MHHHKLYFIWALLLLAGLNSSGQTREIDSIEVLLAKSKTDSAKAENLFQLGIEYETIDYKISRKIFDSVLDIAVNKKYLLLEARVCNEIGGLGFDHGDYASAIKFYNRSAMLYSLVKGKAREYGLAAVYNNIGGILSLLNEWESAQRYYLKSLHEYEKLKDTTRMMTVYFNIAFVFSDMDEWDKSYEHMHKAMQLTVGSKSKRQLVTACSRLATICFKTGRHNDGLNYLKLSDSLINLSRGAWN